MRQVRKPWRRLLLRRTTAARKTENLSWCKEALASIALGRGQSCLRHKMTKIDTNSLAWADETMIRAAAKPSAQNNRVWIPACSSKRAMAMDESTAHMLTQTKREKSIGVMVGGFLK